MLKFLFQLFCNLFRRNISLTACVYAGSTIDSTAKIHRGCKVRTSNVGAHSYVAANSWLTNADVGKFCSIGNNVSVGLATHTLEYISSSPIFTLRRNATGVSWISEDIAESTDDFPRTTIEADAWIGSNSIIKSGITIGVGAVIGAGAIVTKDVEPYAVVGGVPARLIRYRFDEPTRQALLKSRWWELPDDVLRSKLKAFQSPALPDNIAEKMAELSQNA